MESGKTILNSKPILIGRIVREAFESLSLKAGDKGIKYTLANDIGADTYIFGDEVRIKQILINLLNNAIKFTPPNKAGEIKNSIKLHAATRLAGNQRIIEISVADTGAGIDGDDMKLLFQEFKQTQSGAAQGADKGTGLGLALSQKLAKAMGGDITVASQYGRGSTFTFSFPEVLVPSEQIPEEEKPREGIAGKPLGLSIFIAEDNPTNQLLLQALLAGNDLVVTENGLELLRELLKRIQHKQTLPSVILSDMNMPVLNGLQLLQLLAIEPSRRDALIDTFTELDPATQRELRGIPQKDLEILREIPIIVQSADVMGETSQACTKAGAKDFISKPLEPGALYSVIRKWAPERSVPKAENLPPRVSRQVSSILLPVTLVIAEDDPTSRDLLAAYLPKNPHAFVNNGLELIQELLRRLRARGPLPDVILLDIAMPRMGGMDFLRLLNSAEGGRQPFIETLSKLTEGERGFLRAISQEEWMTLKRVPIITQSASGFSTGEMVAEGATSFVAKPTDPAELLAAIHQAVARVPPAPQNEPEVWSVEAFPSRSEMRAAEILLSLSGVEASLEQARVTDVNYYFSPH